MFKLSLFRLIMASKLKSRNASNLAKPKRNCEVLSLRKEVKVLDLIRKETKLYAEVAKI